MGLGYVFVCWSVEAAKWWGKADEARKEGESCYSNEGQQLGQRKEGRKGSGFSRGRMNE